MFHFGRCGSTITAQYLSKNYDLYWANEIYEQCNLLTNGDVLNPSDPFNVLERHQYRARTKYFGLEIKIFKGQHLDQNLNNLTIQELIKELKIRKFDKFVLLKRSNFLQQYYSAHYGDQTKSWFISSSNLKSKNRRKKIILPVNPASMGSFKVPLKEYFDEMNRVYDEVLEQLKEESLLILNYEEDVLQNSKGGYKKIMDFIGYRVYGQNLKEDFVKGNVYPMKELIANFEDVEHQLRDTPYEWMLST